MEVIKGRGRRASLVTKILKFWLKTGAVQKSLVESHFKKLRV